MFGALSVRIMATTKIGRIPNATLDAFYLTERKLIEYFCGHTNSPCWVDFANGSVWRDDCGDFLTQERIDEVLSDLFSGAY